MQDKNILVTVESHRQIVMNPEQMASQSKHLRDAADTLQSHYNKQQNISQNINDSADNQQRLPLFNYLYDKIAEAHNKAMPEFLKEKSPDRIVEQIETERVVENPDSIMIIEEKTIITDKALDDIQRNDFPITTQDIQDALLSDTIPVVNTERVITDKNLMEGPLIDLTPGHSGHQMNVKPDIADHYSHTINQFPVITSNDQLTNDMNVERLRNVSHFNDLINPFPVLPTQESYALGQKQQLDSSIIDKTNVTHYNDLRNPFPVLPTQIESNKQYAYSAFGPTLDDFEQRNVTHFNDLINPFPATTNTKINLIGGVIDDSNKEHTDVVKATQAITDPTKRPLYDTLVVTETMVIDPTISPLSHTPEFKERVMQVADELIHHPKDTISHLIQDAERVEHERIKHLEEEKMAMTAQNSESPGLLGSFVKLFQHSSAKEEEHQPITSTISGFINRHNPFSQSDKSGSNVATHVPSVTGDEHMDDVDDLFLFNGS